MAIYFVKTERQHKELGHTTITRFSVRACSVDHANDKAWKHMSRHHYDELKTTTAYTDITSLSCKHCSFPLVTIDNKGMMKGIPCSTVY